MWRDPKYIVYENEMGVKVPIIFSAFEQHIEIARGLGGQKVLSAGFVSFEDGEVNAYGRSMTLRMSSDPERDSRIIKEHLRFP